MTRRPRRPAAARLVALVTVSALAVGCGSARRDGAVPASLPRAELGRVLPVDADLKVDRDLITRRPGALDPGVLLPKAPATDDVIARIGEFVLHKSHVYDRWLETNRREVRTFVDLLTTDVVIAENARRLGVTVDGADVDAFVAEEEKRLRRQVELEWGGRLSFPDYLRRTFDMDEAEFTGFRRRELGRQLYRSYVIRYMAMLEDRIEVRICVNRDRQLLDEIAGKVRDGADFATLALRHSEDETRRDGGLMPPFARGYEHPIAKIAFELEPGQLSDVFRFEAGGSDRWCVVYCLRRMPGRDVEFEAVKGEIKASLEERPLSPFEQKAFVLRWSSLIQPLNSGGDSR